jgi:hypothetical protein
MTSFKSVDVWRWDCSGEPVAPSTHKYGVDEKRGELEGKAVLQILAARMLLALRLKKVVGWKERESRYYSGREYQSLR